MPTTYTLKVTLDGVKPAIWRRFVVPGEIPLDQLHGVLQTIMGWTDSHLHAFEVGRQRYELHSPNEDTRGSKDERGVPLAQLPQLGPKLGVSWGVSRRK